LTKRERDAHRHQGNRVNAEPPAQEIMHDPDRQAGDHRHGSDRPAQIRDVGAADVLCEGPRRQSDDCDDKK